MTDDRPAFRGFYAPNTTPVPDAVFDELLADLTGSELKVLMYIIRRTLGFKRWADAISLSQMMYGITTTTGKVLDRGTGIRKKQVLLLAIKALTERGAIVTERRQSAERGHEPTIYRLNILDAPPLGYQNGPPLGTKGDHPLGTEMGDPLGTKGNKQQTVNQETGLTNHVGLNGSDPLTTIQPSLTALVDGSGSGDDQAETNDPDDPPGAKPPPVRRTPEQIATYQGAAFARLWAFYGKVGGVEQAAKEWDKLRPGRQLLEQIIAAITLQRSVYRWGLEGGQAQPDLSTWLHQRRWEREPVPNRVERGRL